MARSNSNAYTRFMRRFGLCARWSSLLLMCCTPAPKRPELAVPDVRQSTDYTCGASALQAVLAYYGVGAREDQLSREMGATPQDGVPPEAIVRVARSHGLTAEMRENMTVDDLAAALLERRPVVVEVQAWADGPRTDWVNDWDDGHYAVVIAIEGDELVFEDPSVLGSRAVLPRHEFEERWHDIDLGRRHVRTGIVFGGKVPAPPGARVRMR
jgi:predicted double-glycine peptidase